jgi:hypothetical protein
METDKYAALFNVMIKLRLYTHSAWWKRYTKEKKLIEDSWRVCCLLSGISPLQKWSKKGGKSVRHERRAWKNGFRYNDVMISPPPLPPTVPSCKMYYECNLE